VSLRANVLGGIALLLAGVLTLNACAAIPADPDDTLHRATGRTLHAGASTSEGLVSVADGEPAGPLVDLVEGFAATIDADVEWTVGSEEDLVKGLEAGDLDVAVGGMTSDTPWIDRAGMTRGYPGVPGADGRETVMFVPLGENAMLTALETYLDAEVGS
jgi:DNA-binding transcriptional LysR family regulator